MENYLLISDAAKAVQVEAHVLRYWEEELRLPIRRNELGHRYYTEEDVERFKHIKSMKERGLQLKAIKMILKNGKLDVLTQGEEGLQDEKSQMDKPQDEKTQADKLQGNKLQGNKSQDDKLQGNKPQDDKLQTDKLLADKSQGDWLQGDRLQAQNRQDEKRYRGKQAGESDWLEPTDVKGTEVVADGNARHPESREEKAQRLQWIMQQLIREAMRENNAEMVKQIKECVLKELDYQFRMQEERQEERAKEAAERTEGYYRQMDELLRKKSSKKVGTFLGKNREDKKQEKKKKHFAS